MAALRGTEIISVLLKEAAGKTKHVPVELYQETGGLFWGK